MKKQNIETTFLFIFLLKPHCCLTSPLKALMMSLRFKKAHLFKDYTRENQNKVVCFIKNSSFWTSKTNEKSPLLFQFQWNFQNIPYFLKSQHELGKLNSAIETQPGCEKGSLLLQCNHKSQKTRDILKSLITILYANQDLSRKLVLLSELSEWKGPRTTEAGIGSENNIYNKYL